MVYSPSLRQLLGLLRPVQCTYCKTWKVPLAKRNKSFYSTWKLGDTQNIISSPFYDEILPLVIFDLQHGWCHVGYGTYIRTLNIFIICEIIQWSDWEYPSCQPGQWLEWETPYWTPTSPAIRPFSPFSTSHVRKTLHFLQGGMETFLGQPLSPKWVDMQKRYFGIQTSFLS